MRSHTFPPHEVGHVREGGFLAVVRHDAVVTLTRVPPLKVRRRKQRLQPRRHLRLLLRRAAARPIEEAKLALLAKRSREIAVLAHLLAEAAAGHAEGVQTHDADRRHSCSTCRGSSACCWRWGGKHVTLRRFRFLAYLGFGRRSARDFLALATGAEVPTKLHARSGFKRRGERGEEQTIAVR